ncbi:TPA: glycosyl transferase [Patescibacteria group bacterium]|uniref:Mannosyl transferase n=2 Tax=Bacteria division Kazan-3B-28 TaxID=1798534 RepID=A0A0G1KUP0_UNCK3|nr:MAG: Mannosyl transferase [candidate division Kazan bacterium GW2011_GWA1_44_22]KKT87215.1 MAG: Mannosyl transferase [candidate division Kazan bacterium GW2011_GWB1_45_10]HCR42200.1 glycosyl transferase [Patescibacteria group bacterium]
METALKPVGGIESSPPVRGGVRGGGSIDKHSPPQHSLHLIGNRSLASSDIDVAPRGRPNLPSGRGGKIKIALVHDFLVKIGGAEKVTGAISELFPEAPIYTLLYHPRVGALFPQRKIIVSYLQLWQKFLHLPTKFLLPFMALAIESFDFTGYDLVISSNHSFAGGIITSPETVHISYCHSPTRYLWDAFHTYINEQRLNGLGKRILYGLLHQLRIWDKLSSGRVQKYIAISQYVKNRIRKYYRQDSAIIYPPVDTDKIKPAATHSDYFLIVSRLTPYKKIDLAIAACNTLRLPLVIIGTGEDEARLKKLAGFSIDFLGWQNDANKIKYLQNCRAVIFPGEEDFGIVPVEAMAAGRPVIAYRKGGTLETIQEGVTGMFFDQPTAASLTQTLQKFLQQENNFVVDKITQQAEKFNKSRFQAELIKLITNELKACGKL